MPRLGRMFSIIGSSTSSGDSPLARPPSLRDGRGTQGRISEMHYEHVNRGVLPKDPSSNKSGHDRGRSTSVTLDGDDVLEDWVYILRFDRTGNVRWASLLSIVDVRLQRFSGDGGSIASHVVDVMMKWEHMQVGRRCPFAKQALSLSCTVACCEGVRLVVGVVASALIPWEPFFRRVPSCLGASRMPRDRVCCDQGRNSHNRITRSERFRRSSRCVVPSTARQEGGDERRLLFERVVAARLMKGKNLSYRFLLVPSNVGFLGIFAEG
eukprot:scaffold626_cov337-Pavlova_lutheri.AAC.58